MSNPYAGLPAYAFWKDAVGGLAADDVDLVVKPLFTLNKMDRIAPAGSCFAQHISRTLAAEGYNYLVTETAPLSAGARDEGYGVFPARFGNLYTTTQLRQLFERAYGLFEPADRVMPGRRGGFIDPFRPRVQDGGFATEADCLADTEAHLGAVRTMFETCDVFIFTLGLTEAWRSKVDHAVYPIAPGVSAAVDADAFEFVNYDVETVAADLIAAISMMREINPDLRVILTVSPVPLIATYEPRHVLVSTTYSKSVLRVAAETVRNALPDVDYFPSFEMITGNYRRSEFYAEDLREVIPEGVAHVMSRFKRHYLDGGSSPHHQARPTLVARVMSRFKRRYSDGGSSPRPQARPNVVARGFDERSDFAIQSAVICDEEAIVE